MSHVQNTVEIGHFAGVVADIARTLESPQDADARISRVLALLRTLVPCDRCALCTRPGAQECALAVVPEVSEADRARLTALLHDILHFMQGYGERAQRFDSRAHLALPVIGQDEILGVLLVDREGGEEYEPHHLRLLSAVASQLGAYLTMVRLHVDTAQHAAILADRERQLRGTSRFREEFIGVIGHDLRNPLSAIRTGAQLLSERARLDPADAAIAGRIVLSADRMARMVDELLDFARGRLGGGIPLRRTMIDLQALCKVVIDEIQTAHKRRISLHVSGDPHGYWDGDRLAQVVSNLVGNAVEHSPRESTVTVSVRSQREHAIIITVHNTGTPIPAAHLEHMFEPFHSGDRAKSTGLGLGLYIVERVVHAHGGTIAVRSTEAEGTTFDICLPREGAAVKVADS